LANALDSAGQLDEAFSVTLRAVQSWDANGAAVVEDVRLVSHLAFVLYVRANSAGQLARIPARTNRFVIDLAGSFEGHRAEEVLVHNLALASSGALGGLALSHDIEDLVEGWSKLTPFFARYAEYSVVRDAEAQANFTLLGVHLENGAWNEALSALAHAAALSENDDASAAVTELYAKGASNVVFFTLPNDVEFARGVARDHRDVLLSDAYMSILAQLGWDLESYRHTLLDLLEGRDFPH
jgi:hypothetical protein